MSSSEIQGIYKFIAKFSQMKSALETIQSIVRNPNNRGVHTLYQQCELMDKIDEIIQKSLQGESD